MRASLRNRCLGIATTVKGLGKGNSSTLLAESPGIAKEIELKIRAHFGLIPGKEAPADSGELDVLADTGGDQEGQGLAIGWFARVSLILGFKVGVSIKESNLLVMVSWLAFPPIRSR
jgi:hypothetical protein